MFEHSLVDYMYITSINVVVGSAWIFVVVLILFQKKKILNFQSEAIIRNNWRETFALRTAYTFIYIKNKLKVHFLSILLV